MFSIHSLGMGISIQGMSECMGKVKENRQAVLPQEQDNLREQDLEPTGVSQAS